MGLNLNLGQNPNLGLGLVLDLNMDLSPGLDLDLGREMGLNLGLKPNQDPRLELNLSITAGAKLEWGCAAPAQSMFPNLDVALARASGSPWGQFLRGGRCILSPLGRLVRPPAGAHQSQVVG